ncbi:hypothetical protein RN001_009430 [Aquatica leii]|uniref:Endonuclease-reverse transcriptase n=1 Tax=Aquatica leii TaxID=1421715 RepID=A0AAN7P4P3_9COLE|nr:hypothetical protein RN001_009430 [Aquatica leii]
MVNQNWNHVKLLLYITNYLGTIVDKDGIGKQEIQQKVQSARKAIGTLNAIWWDKHISKKNKKRIGQTMVKKVLGYGSEVWTIKEDDKRKIMAVEMDHLRRSARKPRLEHVRNDEIRRTMEVTETIIERIEKRSLKWFGHILRMEENKWPKRLFAWKPTGKNKKSRARCSWNDGIRKAMRDRDLKEDVAYNRKAWKLEVGRQPAVV